MNCHIQEKDVHCVMAALHLIDLIFKDVGGCTNNDLGDKVCYKVGP